MTLVQSKLSRSRGRGKKKTKRMSAYRTIAGALARSARTCQSKNILRRIPRFRGTRKLSAHPLPLFTPRYDVLASESSNTSQWSSHNLADPVMITTGAAPGNHHSKSVIQFPQEGSARHLLCALLRARGGKCPTEHRGEMTEVAQWMQEKIVQWAKGYWNPRRMYLEQRPPHCDCNRNL